VRHNNQSTVMSLNTSRKIIQCVLLGSIVFVIYISIFTRDQNDYLLGSDYYTGGGTAVLRQQNTIIAATDVPRHTVVDENDGNNDVEDPVQNLSSCVHKSSFHFVPWKSMEGDNTVWNVMATAGMRPLPSGFSGRCDWVFGMRKGLDVVPESAFGSTDTLPKTIFVLPPMLQRFHEGILPCIPTSHRFVLIIGEYDQTTPAQINRNFKSPFIEPSVWQSWLDDKRILHMFVGNLDTVSPVDRVTPFPLGLSSWEYAFEPDVRFDAAPPERTFPTTNDNNDDSIKIFFDNRIRKGKRRVDYKNATDACTSLPYCSLPIGNIRFPAMIQNNTFIFCLPPGTGGIDPNPRVFEVLLSGGIPIIASFPGDSMYRDDDMPIVVIEGAWNASSPSLSREFLKMKLEEFRPYFADRGMRASVLEKLTSKYWWNKVEYQLSQVKL